MMGATTRSSGPPERTPPNLVQEVYLDKLVAFSPENEPRMKSKHFRPVGTGYIVGRLCRRPLRGKFESLFEIRWLDTQFQLAVEHVSYGAAQRGVENYELLTRQKNNPDWQELVKGGLDDELDVEGDADLQVMEDYEAYDPGVLLPTSFEDIEAIENMRFEPVLFETNKYAVTYDIRISRPFTLIELMIFLNMGLNKKGAYANYWGSQPEDLVFGGSSTSLDAIMSLSRFKLLRRCFSFNEVPTTLEHNAAARIRPLINLLKITGGLYVDVGRNVALDEASVAYRSYPRRHMIVFNPMKPPEGTTFVFRLFIVHLHGSH
ncbi:unnamed protein product [Phytophthora fragariaefolia]|uniref:Unnamed protein product n=1 Tax=Phytophthora fragariaefolia TaxID=1490495 RepID=A0A9W6XUL5_9STRA|nr:unnamed protein product [Phytophthora fragariaefolia]